MGFQRSRPTAYSASRRRRPSAVAGNAGRSPPHGSMQGGSSGSEMHSTRALGGGAGAGVEPSSYCG